MIKENIEKYMQKNNIDVLLQIIFSLNILFIILS